MMKKTPLILLIAGFLTALAIIFSGCSTKKPWGTNPNFPLTVSLVSGPTDSLLVPASKSISFSWAATGGTGAVKFQHRLNDGSWSELADASTATLSELAEGIYTFDIQAQDAEGHTSTLSNVFRVAASIPVPPDTIPPMIFITQAPEESSFVAVGSVIAFAWTGFDSLGSGNDLLFQYTYGETTSEWLPIRTVSFSNVAAANPEVFSVKAKDLAGNVSVTASVTFVIRRATVLYVDDYQWLDSFGNVDRVKEREQKAFYREALKGYAFAEWDNDVQGHVPTMADLTGITTIVWAADADICAAEPNFRLYVDIGAVGGGVLKQFIDGGGHLLLTGNQVLNYIFDTNPPSSTHFEAAYLGVSDTTAPATWAASTDFTWAIKDPVATISLPDSMKIDVAKNGTQLACDASLIFLRPGVLPLFKVGLDVSGSAPDDYGMVNAWMYRPAGRIISATLNFDTFSMPLPGIRQTFHSVLNQFGEGPGL
jgi:hypothetical protein